MMLIDKGHHELKGVVEANATVRKTAEDGYQAVEGKLLWKRRTQLCVAVLLKTTGRNICISTIEARVLHFAVQRRLVTRSPVTTKFS